MQPHLVCGGQVEIPLDHLEVPVDPAAPIEIAGRFGLHGAKPVHERAGNGLLADPGPVEQARDHRVDLARSDRLHQIAADVLAECLGEGPVLLTLRHHDDLKSGIDFPQLLQRLKPPRSRHLLIEQHEVERATPYQLESVIGVGGGLHFEAFVTQEDAMWLEQLRFIVYPEDGLHLVGHESQANDGRTG